MIPSYEDWFDKYGHKCKEQLEEWIENCPLEFFHLIENVNVDDEIEALYENESSVQAEYIYESIKEKDM